MKKINLIMLMSLMTIFTLTQTSCSKDDEFSDTREQAVGSYQGTFTILAASDYKTKFLVDNIQFSVAKDKDNSSSIKIDLEGDVIKGVKVAKASNGFTFDIEKQYVDLDEDGTKDELLGVDYFDLGGTVTS